MEAGRMREQIAIQAKSVSRDAYGAEVVGWATHAEVWAEAQPLAGREYVAMRQAQAEISIRFRTRYVAGVNPAMRVLWDGRGYDIVEAIDVGARRRELELLCRGEAGDV
jgi:SPP1 family predicted phage head-tail adaptor